MFTSAVLLGHSLILSCFKAPDEAEAELAVLSKKGLIDMVLTSDSNALVFGATCVSRW